MARKIQVSLGVCTEGPPQGPIRRKGGGASKLQEELKQVFQTKRLGDCRPPVVIPATVIDRFGHRVFTTLDGGDDGLLLASDAALASGAAPSYFEAVTPQGLAGSYVDGGLWANTPSLVAVLTAHQRGNVPFSDMRVLSVGNGKLSQGRTRDDFNAVVPLELLGLTLEIMFAAQSDAADQLVQALLGQGNVVVVNPELTQQIRLDDVAKARATLPGLAEAEVQRTRDQVSRLLQLPRSP